MHGGPVDVEVNETHQLFYLQLIREIHELEGLCEHKIWREGALEEQVKELEQRLQEAQSSSHRDVTASRASTNAGPCMLCHGAHDLEDCPSYRGDTSMTDGEGSPGPSQNGDSPLFSKSTNVIQLGKSNLGREHVFCENCAVSRGTAVD